MPNINGKFYDLDEVRNIHQWYERELWQEDVKTALGLIVRDSGKELARYILARWDKLIEELAPDIPDHMEAIMEHSAQNGLSLRNLIEDSIRKRIEDRNDPKGKEFLRDKISIINVEQYELLIGGELPKEQRNRTGLYMVIEPNGLYIACDYSIQARWMEQNGEPDNKDDLPEGWVEEFRNPVDAVDWLLDALLEKPVRQDDVSGIFQPPGPFGGKVASGPGQGPSGRYPLPGI